MIEASRNMLSIWLGAYLFKRRRMLKKGVEELAEAMSISPAYLRQIENGITNVAPSRALDLQKGLQTVLLVPANFAALSMFLTAIQYLTDRSTTAEEARLAIGSLRRSNSGLNKLFNGLNEKIWFKFLKGEYNDLKDMFLQEWFVSALEIYLIDTDFAMPKIQNLESRWSRLYGNMPSVWNPWIFSAFENTQRQIHTLESMAPYFNLNQWESDVNKGNSKLQRIWGLLSNTKLLTDYVEDFSWFYLHHNVQLTCYVINATERELKDAADRIISQLTNNVIDIPLENVRRNLRIMSLTNADALLIISALEWKGGQGDCWIYEVEKIDPSENYVTHIGFHYVPEGVPSTVPSEEISSYIRKLNISQYQSLTNNQVSIIKDILFQYDRTER